MLSIKRLFYKKKVTVFHHHYSVNGDNESGYIENYRPGEDALVIHGSTSQLNRVIYERDYDENGRTWFSEQRLSAEELVQRIRIDFGIDLSAKKRPLHLISCYVSGGVNRDALVHEVFGQHLANCTGRVVLAYDEGQTVEVNQGSKHRLIKSQPVENGCRMKPQRTFFPDYFPQPKKMAIPRPNRLS